MRTQLIVVTICFLVALVSCDNDQDDGQISRQGAGLVPEWVAKQENVETHADAATSKRPPVGDITDVIGQGLQGLLQGIVKAPGQIANRVQGIFEGIRRRSTTARPGAVIPTEKPTPAAPAEVPAAGNPAYIPSEGSL